MNLLPSKKNYSFMFKFLADEKLMSKIFWLDEIELQSQIFAYLKNSKNSLNFIRILKEK